MTIHFVIPPLWLGIIIGWVSLIGLIVLIGAVSNWADNRRKPDPLSLLNETHDPGPTNPGPKSA